jgi:hypothetical protein
MYGKCGRPVDTKTAQSPTCETKILNLRISANSITIHENGVIYVQRLLLSPIFLIFVKILH